MSLLGICMIVLGIYVAIKVVSFVIRISMAILVIFGLYLLLGPLVGG